MDNNALLLLIYFSQDVVLGLLLEISCTGHVVTSAHWAVHRIPEPFVHLASLVAEYQKVA